MNKPLTKRSDDGFSTNIIAEQERAYEKLFVGKKPIFTTKHYKAIAKRIGETNILEEKEKETVSIVLSNLFIKDNPKFSELEFYKLVAKEIVKS